MNNLKDNHKKELETTKSNLTDLYEKQISFLNDSMGELKLKNQSVKSELNEKKSDYDGVIMENRNLQ